MEAKLTLKINERTIDKAKKYAINQNRSLSKIVEDYLTILTLPTDSESNENDIAISPFVKSISSGNSIPSDLDYKTLYSNYLIDKYK